jgi:hypothetical protein
MAAKTRKAATLVATGAALVAAHSYAQCAPPSYETLVRGHFVRCENGLLHAEAAGGNLTAIRRQYSHEPEAFERLREPSETAASAPDGRARGDR